MYVHFHLTIQGRYLNQTYQHNLRASAPRKEEMMTIDSPGRKTGLAVAFYSHVIILCPDNSTAS
jgi:hypothetical protein